VVEHTQIRAVSIRPEIAKRITPVNMNIVFQHLAATDLDQKFDLIIGTNIFIYYAAFEQSLARANLAGMLNPSGFALTNDLLADNAPSHLEEAHRTIVEISSQAQVFDRIYCYRRQP
jgi:chemotaxis methyl-accepting protein methylase